MKLPLNSTTFLIGKAKVDYFVMWVFFIAFAGQAVRNTVDWLGYGLMLGVTVGFLTHFYWKQLRDLTVPPFFLTSYVGLAGLSVFWSAYKPETALGFLILLVTTAVGWVLVSLIHWKVLLLSLYSALKWIIVLSLLFEVYVATVLKNPLLPLPFIGNLEEGFPPSYFWSYGILLDGGPIQGIVGNRNLLGFIALLLIVVAAVIALSGLAKILSSTLWIMVGLLVHVLTDSATISAGLFAVVVVTLSVFVMRRVKPRFHRRAYLILTGLAGVFIISVGLFSTTFFALLGRSPDMTNRFGIWRQVAGLAVQRPEGWGWIGHWAPWVEPFKNFVIVDNTVQLHAHNALIDVWLQLGIVGVIIAVIVAVTAAVRAWRLSVDDRTYPGASLAPLLLLCVLLVQSISESRLLIEGNWMLFSMICFFVKTNAPYYGSWGSFINDDKTVFDKIK